jgi:hypothetical protein
MPDPSSTPPGLCIQWLAKNSCDALEVVASGLNSSFSTALLGSLAGAFAGAIAAQKIVEKSKLREETLKELRNTNAAAMAAFTACNSALALKRQHVQPLHSQFMKDKAALLEFETQHASGQKQGNAPFHFVADLRTFPVPVVPVDSLKDLLFNKITVTGRSLALVCAVEEASRGLQSAVAMRLAMVERIKSKEIPDELLPSYYFGLPLPNGDTNREYPDLVAGIESYADDLAYFSYLLCSDLTQHAKLMHGKLPRQVREAAPKPTEADFTQPRASGLIPPDTQYQLWLRAFPAPRGTESSAEAW